MKYQLFNNSIIPLGIFFCVCIVFYTTFFFFIFFFFEHLLFIFILIISYVWWKSVILDMKLCLPLKEISLEFQESLVERVYLLLLPYRRITKDPKSNKISSPFIDLGFRSKLLSIISQIATRNLFLAIWTKEFDNIFNCVFLKSFTNL